MVSRTRGIREDPSDAAVPLDPELSYHIQHCPCTCDHMGYGNYLNYQVPPPPYVHQPEELPFDRPSASRLNIHNHPCHYFEYEYEVTSTTCSCGSSDSDSSTSYRSCGSWCLCLFVCVVVGTVAVALSIPFTMTATKIQHRSHEERLKVVRKLLKDAPLIDGHNDLPWNLRKFVHNKLLTVNLSGLEGEEPWSRSRWSHTDIPRLRMGLLGAQFWSAYVPCKSQYLDAVQLTLEQIDVVHRLAELNAQHLTMVRTSSELITVHQQGRIASLIGVEGGHALGNSLAVLRTFYNLGARYLTITHTCDTPWATSANTSLKDVYGLSDFGKSVIQEMNRLGMMIDLSHASMVTARAAINASRAPVIFSHSGAYSLCNSTRNVPDDVLQLLARNRGIIMVNFYAHLVTCSANATVHDVIKHINHIRKVAGVDCVGIGAGYDGINVTPSGLENVSKYPHLFAELLADPSWTEEDVIRLAGRNLLRVFKEVEEVRDKWKLAEVPPGEDSAPYVSTQCTTMYS